MKRRKQNKKQTETNKHATLAVWQNKKNAETNRTKQPSKQK